MRYLLVLSVAAVGCGKPADKPPPKPANKPAPTQVETHQAQPAPTRDGVFFWMNDEAAARAQATKENKRLIVDFGAKWCAPCVELEKTFADPRVAKVLIANYVGWKRDVTEQTDEDVALQKKYGAESLPNVVILDPSGKELHRLIEAVTPEQFLAILEKL